jgi:hypothetical protein
MSPVGPSYRSMRTTGRMTIAAGSDFSTPVLDPDPVRSIAGKLMTIPILLPPPLAAARCKSAAARFDSRKVNAPLTERSYPIFEPVLLQQSRSHDLERIARAARRPARAWQTGSIFARLCCECSLIFICSGRSIRLRMKATISSWRFGSWMASVFLSGQRSRSALRAMPPLRGRLSSAWQGM